MSSVVVFGLVEERFYSRLREAPGTGVERFFLSPHDILSVGITIQVFLQLSPREWIQLLNAGNSHITDLALLTMLDKRCVNLAGTQDNSFNLVRLVN